MQIANSTTFDQMDPDIAMFPDGSFVVVWDASNAADGSYRGIFGRRFDAAGSPLGDEFPVNQGTVGDQNDAVVAAAADGGFVVVWETNALLDEFEDLVARRFDSAALPVGDDFQVNVFTTGDQEDADIAVSDTGDFVVVWESESQDGSYDGVFGRRLDSTGQPLGGEFAVNTYVPGDQDDPSLAVGPDGTFVVAWEDDTQLDADDSIWARFFDAAGVPLDTPFQVETSTGYQFSPQVAFDGDGQAIIVWDGSEAGNLFSGDIFARSYSVDGQPTSDEVPVFEGAGHQILPVVAFGDRDGIVVWTGDTGDGSMFGVFARQIVTPLFADGFESGDTSAWSSTVP